ncbi:MAG: hypothetical protein FJZ58_06610 [Chlamydiae bacterium]|nr:hypothetical protein [Chlamydiota bacterium]
MLQRAIKDTVIVHHMLDQSIAIPYGTNDITQLSSSLNFDEKGIPAFYLSEEIQEYMSYPDPTETLILF